MKYVDRWMDMTSPFCAFHINNPQEGRSIFSLKFLSNNVIQIMERVNGLLNHMNSSAEPL
jgi:hypothetical protein